MMDVGRLVVDRTRYVPIRKLQETEEQSTKVLEL